MVRVGKSSTWWKYVSTAVRGSVRRKVTPVSRRVELYTWVRKTDCKWSNFFQSILMRLDEYFPLKNMTSWAQTTSKTACADFPLDVDDCLRLEWSCENGGQAVDTGKSCECQCTAGYTGENCQTGKVASKNAIQKHCVCRYFPSFVTDCPSVPGSVRVGRHGGDQRR